MKKLLFVTLLIGMFGCLCFSQVTKIDSLKILIRKAKDDTTKVNQLNQLAREYMYSYPDSSFLFSTQAHELAEKQKWKKGIANSILIRAYLKLMKGDIDTALLWSNQSLVLCEEDEDKSGQAAALNVIAFVYEDRGDFTNSLENQIKALNLVQELGDKARIAVHQGNIGNIYNKQGDFPRALEYYLKALRINEDLGDKSGIATNRQNAGLVYLNLGDFNKALEYFFKSLKLMEELGNKYNAAVTLNNIGSAYSGLEDNSKVLEYYLRSLKISEELGDKVSTSRTIGNIGLEYYELGNYPDALNSFLKASNIAEEIGDKYLLAAWTDGVGQVYMKTGKFKMAEAAFKRAIILAESIGAKDILRQFEENISDLYSAIKEHDLALVHYKKSMQLKDTLFNQEKAKEITKKAMTYEFDKKEALARIEQEKKDALTRKELQRQKLIRSALTIGFSIVLVFAAVFFIQRNKIKKGKQLSEQLLLNILPSEIAEELKVKGRSDARSFDEVTIMFTDFKNFTGIAERLSPIELVSEIDRCFKVFDNIIAKYNIEKIKTIGDSYMCAGGLPVANKTHAADVIRAALEIQNSVAENKKVQNIYLHEIRIGIHTGPVVAGIVGIKKFSYDIWGDAVNIASRMESSGEAGKINISGATYELVKDQFQCVYRGKIQAKNKGEVDMYFVESTL